MAELKHFRFKPYKLKASMLLEAIVATVIVALSFGLAVGIYSNVIRSGDMKNKLKAQLFLSDYAIKINMEKRYLDEQVTVDDCTVTEKIMKYKDAANLFQLSLTFSNKEGKVLAKHTELVVE